MVEPFLWLCWLNVEPHFIAFLTSKMYRPRISLKIGRFGPGFQLTKCRSIFWKENWCIFDHFVLSLFWARTFLSGELAILKSWIFLIQIFPFGFLSSELLISYTFVNAKRLTNWISKTASKLIVQKLRNMNLFMSHAFFHYFFSNLIYRPSVPRSFIFRSWRCIKHYTKAQVKLFQSRKTIMTKVSVQ